MDNRLLEMLICPRHQDGLEERGEDLVCQAGCVYPVVQGIPVLLRDDIEPTLWVASASLEKARQLRSLPSANADFCIETIGVSPQERASLAAALRSRTENVDPVVSYLVGATNGILYKDVIGHLLSYPIPELRLPFARDALFWILAAIGDGGVLPPPKGAILRSVSILLSAPYWPPSESAANWT